MKILLPDAFRPLIVILLPNKEVFSEKSCFKNFAHPLSEGENIKK